jgi:hypothetical protein
MNMPVLKTEATVALPQPSADVLRLTLPKPS